MKIVAIILFIALILFFIHFKIIGKHAVQNSVDNEDTTSNLYHNPVDGKTYAADWESYEPKTPVAKQTGRVINSGVRLLSSQEDIDKNSTVDELANMINAIEDSLLKSTEKFQMSGDISGEVLVQVALHKSSNPDYKMSYHGNVPEQLLYEFSKSLSEIILFSKETTITFQIHFTLVSQHE